MYRVNRKGEFNVPYGGGRSHAILWERDILHIASGVLKHTTIAACDFANTMRRARDGDVVYCDPTYTTAHNNNGFVRYNECNFSWHDQHRLAEAAARAAARGATVIISNAHHKAIATLYPSWQVRIISRLSLISPHRTARVPITEYLIVSPTRR
jgi:DNA adenine methylase